MAESRAQESRLQGIEPRVETLHLVHVAFARAVVAQRPDLPGEPVVVGRHRARVAEGAEVLRGIEAERRGIAQRAHALASIPRAMGLRRVLEHRDAAALADLANRSHVGRLAIEVHRQDGARAPRDRALDALRVDVVRRLVRFHGNGARSRVAHRKPGRDVGVGGHDHFVSLANAPGAEHEHHGVHAVGDAHAVLRAAVGGEALLERFHLRAEDVPAGAHDAPARLVERGADLRVDGLQGEEGNFHRERARSVLNSEKSRM